MQSDPKPEQDPVEGSPEKIDKELARPSPDGKPGQGSDGPQPPKAPEEPRGKDRP